MSLSERWFPGLLTELSQAECLDELRARHVGRVAYCDAEGPVVVPVNYVMEGQDVLMGLSPYSMLARHLRVGAASFQVDEFDEYTQTGWSVLVRGRASHVEAADHAAADALQPWPSGLRTLHVCLTPTQITGRRLLPA